MHNRLILIGASRGIGRHYLETVVAHEDDILAVGSGEKVGELEELASNIRARKIDLSDLEAIEKPIKSWLDNLTPLSECRYAVVCCASQLGEAGGILDHQAHIPSWIETYKINVLSHLMIIKIIQGQIGPHDKLRIVMFAGGGAAYGYPKFFNYSLTKVATVRAAENIGIEFDDKKLDASIVSIAPGAVDTEMLAKVINAGGEVRTKTDISEPCSFISNFTNDRIDSRSLNGRFVHVRDTISADLGEDTFFLRRIE